MSSGIHHYVRYLILDKDDQIWGSGTYAYRSHDKAARVISLIPTEIQEVPGA